MKETYDRVMAIVDSRPGNRLTLEGLGELDHAKQVMRLWVEGLPKRLDQGHGRKK